MNFEHYLPYLPFAVGCGVAALVFTVFVLRKRTPAKAARVALVDPGSSSATPDWLPSEDTAADRRGSLRREGPPVKVVLSAPSFRSKHDIGYVLDRSTGGLRIAMRLAMAPGSTMQVRAANAPDTVPWVTVIVRNCRNAGQHYELGCEFDRTPPWNVLLLFG